MARSLARHFGTSEIIVIGSQATIVHGDEAALIASDQPSFLDDLNSDPSHRSP